ncbi:ADP-ribosylglycohydrolase family protein [Bacteroidota bacterium]
MRVKNISISTLLIFIISSCNNPVERKDIIMEVSEDNEMISSTPFVEMSREKLYDKILGSLVGSAIGDAMGAPTEMWPRHNIRVEYGWVDRLDDMVREASPEGIWDVNLEAGGTTDDTRWHVFLGNYIANNVSEFYSTNGPDPYNFAQYVVDQYKVELESLKDIDSFSPAPFENQMMRIAWLQEFAIVAKPYAEKDIDGYRNAVNKFYGGEMACPGLLYSPVIGLPYPGAPKLAYESAYLFSIFDIGFTRDISSLTAAMVAAAMPEDSSPEKILAVLSEIDPQYYFKSRLLGRMTYGMYRNAQYIVDEAKKVKSADEVDVKIVADQYDPRYLAQLQKAYDMLDERNQDVPFHSGEIHLINLTALLFTDFDFRKAMEFIINYGRDNDTVAAVTGAILGAYYGYEKLPEDLKAPIFKINKEKLGIDLELLANQLTDRIIENKAVSVN